MGQPEEESDDESQSGGQSPTIPNQERAESSSAVTDADAEKARSEYLETLRQGLKVIESAFDQLTWEINIPQPYREARVMSIQAGAKDYLVAGLRQPEFAGSIIKMFANYCTEQNKLDLFPYIEVSYTSASLPIYQVAIL